MHSAKYCNFDGFVFGLNHLSQRWNLFPARRFLFPGVPFSFRQLAGALAISEPPDCIEVDDEGNESSGGGTEGAAVGDDGAGKCVERE
jgi:hypothetical protein